MAENTSEEMETDVLAWLNNKTSEQILFSKGRVILKMMYGGGCHLNSSWSLSSA